ncbi:MAG: AMP-binding protein [Deltaproteobacteria bacterium]|nr:AMP-binding protein [Deltaproteobacteria bacterium]
MAHKTVMELFDATARSHASKPALKAKKDGRWVETTWAEYREQIRTAARGFVKLGLEPGQGVSILGGNRPEWLVADVGAIYAGGFPAGIYTTSSAEQCQYIADHSDSAIVVVENAEQLAKILEVRGQLPKLKAIVLMSGDSSVEGVHTWARTMELGRSVPESELDARTAAQKPDDVCTLIYTSGTTGNPKAVMITHHNLVWTSRATFEAFGGALPDERAISYLPLSHIAEQAISIYAAATAGGCTWFAESLEKLGENLREVRPTLFVGVPRVWEKIQAKILEVGAQSSPLKKRIGAWARKQGLAGGYADQRHEARPLLYGLAEALVFKKVRANLGLDECRFAITAAAPIAKSTLELFLSLGIPIYEVYGMSECTGPATLSLPGAYKTGKVGKPVPGTEVKLAADGEVLMRGPHVFKGYYKNEEATRETLDEEGWLHSGDVGVIDAEGFLQITDRKKDLLITAGGENIAPQLLEGMLKGIAGVSQAVVVGDRQKFLAALVTLDPAKLPSIASEAGSPAKDMRAASECPKIHTWMLTRLDEVNRHLARVQTIKKVKVLPAELTIESGELTPTMKVKRKVVNERYAAEIAAFYD